MPLNRTKLSDIQPDALVADGTYRARINKAEVQPSKNDSSREVLFLVFELLDDELVTQEGKTIPNTGKAVFQRVGLTPSENYDPDARWIGPLADAIGHSGDDIEPADLVGKEVGIRVEIEVDKEGTYPDKNRVVRVIKAPASKPY